jgi:hypothetical protein
VIVDRDQTARQRQVELEPEDHVVVGDDEQR